MESVCIQESACPHHRKRSPLHRHTGEASGIGQMTRFTLSVIDTDRRITYLHFTSTVKWSRIYHHENGKRGGTMLPGIGIIANVAAIALGGVYMMITSLIGGGLIGELLNIEARMTAFGAWLKRVSGSAGDTRFIEGFVTASLTVCIGAMAVIGSINDRLLGDPSVLFTKSVLDGVIIMLLTATLGKGCIFSSVSVGLFQGAIFALAGLLAPYMTDSALAGLSCVGNILIFAIGTNLLGLPNIRVANFLPALVIAALWGMG